MKKPFSLVLVMVIMCALKAVAQDTIRQSVNSIHNQVESREKQEQTESDRKSQDYSNIGKRYSDEILKNADTSSSAAANTRGYKGYNPQATVKNIKDAGQAEASNVQQYYSKQSEASKQAEKRRHELLEQSALNLEKQLVTPSNSSAPQLQPLGTNLYVRNYYSPPTPEFVAKQKKLNVNLKKPPNAKQ